MEINEILDKLEQGNYDHPNQKGNLFLRVRQHIEKVEKKLQELNKVWHKNEPMESVDINGNHLQELYDFIDRLNNENEKLKKVIELLKKKKVNVFHIWVFDNYKQYKEHYPFAEYHAKKDMLTQEEYELIKEVLGE